MIESVATPVTPDELAMKPKCLSLSFYPEMTDKVDDELAPNAKSHAVQDAGVTISAPSVAAGDPAASSRVKGGPGMFLNHTI